MPLEESGSNEALHKNIATEIEAGKSPSQSAAIGYSVQRAHDADIEERHLPEGTANLPTVCTHDDIQHFQDENRERQGIGGEPPYESEVPVPVR